MAPLATAPCGDEVLCYSEADSCLLQPVCVDLSGRYCVEHFAGKAVEGLEFPADRFAGELVEPIRHAAHDRGFLGHPAQEGLRISEVNV
ncbi:MULTISPECIES: hypothetical protein [Cupriavidus]|uniref:hypothetical protein n=1 Tax=Cupriavidus TaxID=106589 RepID=UPI0012E095D2|nr:MULTISPECIES: hypothetical protein [Cupriavidus]